MVGKTALMSAVLVMGLTGQSLAASPGLCEYVGNVGDVFYDTLTKWPDMGADELGMIGAVGFRRQYPNTDLNKAIAVFSIVAQFVKDHKKNSKALVKRQLILVCGKDELFD